MNVIKAMPSNFEPPFALKIKATMAQPDASNGPTLRALSFSEMINGTVADVVDANHDMLISQQEYLGQIVSAGGTQAQSDALYRKLDANGDGQVSSFELRDSLADPTAGTTHDALVKELFDQIQAGQSTTRPAGTVLNAQGQIADAASVARYIYTHFPGNVDVV
ncbi:hypothetical protein SAMN05428959_101672 [Duganella sp. CF517]|uniref:hypothetical protein n=1 Tax=Duganella sp. CF517 TaxID=1881038 RepID=UPI0008AF0C1D|nr:hypothetical protein [Duganella sp. CF517]SEN20917.1 hypothetical protein SAMN05428959_101672 [Duganella sp. CF517]